MQQNFFVKNSIFRQKFYFSSKILFFVKHSIFRQKFYCSSKILIFIQRSKFCAYISIFIKDENKNQQDKRFYRKIKLVLFFLFNMNFS